jgi:hypothetical protein
LGIAIEWVFRKATQGISARLAGLPLETVHNRLQVIGARFGLATGSVVSFALGSTGAFLAFDWPPLLRQVVSGSSSASRWSSAAFCWLPRPSGTALFPWILKPPGSGAAGLPYPSAGLPSARHSSGLRRGLGWSLEARQLVAYVLGLGLLAIAIDAAPPEARGFGRGAGKAALSAAFALLRAAWAAHAMKNILVTFGPIDPAARVGPTSPIRPAV